jgi:two-component system, NarL family, response regulator LiaR
MNKQALKLQNMNPPLITVSIVEDNLHIRESISSLLNESKACACISSYETGEAALAELPELQPDIVLMDIGLPGMDGIACIKKLKPLCIKTQFMVCTVHDEDEKVFDAIAAGANAYILKGSNSNALIAAVTDLHQGGSPMSSDIARKLVKQYQKITSPVQLTVTALLTAKEKEIIVLLAKGLTYQQAAGSIYISPKTIKKHIYNIYEKLQVSSRTEAINKYYGR